MRIRTTRGRGIGLAKAFECMGVPSHRIDWKLQSGRLNPKEEDMIMKHLKANKLDDATDAMIHGRNSFRGASCKELIEKRWITKKDIMIAKKLKPAIMR